MSICVPLTQILTPSRPRSHFWQEALLRAAKLTVFIIRLHTIPSWEVPSSTCRKYCLSQSWFDKLLKHLSRSVQYTSMTVRWHCFWASFARAYLHKPCKSSSGRDEHSGSNMRWMLWVACSVCSCIKVWLFHWEYHPVMILFCSSWTRPYPLVLLLTFFHRQRQIRWGSQEKASERFPPFSLFSWNRVLNGYRIYGNQPELPMNVAD